MDPLRAVPSAGDLDQAVIRRVDLEGLRYVLAQELTAGVDPSELTDSVNKWVAL